MNKWYTFYFACEGRKDGQTAYTEQDYTHEDEEQARRELVHTLNHLHHFYPRKITLLKVEEFKQNIWNQLD